MANIVLRRFMQGWQASPVFQPPENPLLLSEYGSEFVLFRSGPFQVELIVTNPHITVPAHAHPNVDTYERFIQQSGGYCWEGKRTMTSQQLSTVPHRYSGFIPAGMAHGAYTGDGAAFLSFQHWKGVSPSFITKDWSAA